MIFAKEITAPFIIDAKESDVPLYTRIDITKQSDVDNFFTCDHHNKIPVLFLPLLNVHPLHMDDRFTTHAIQKFVATLTQLLSRGITRSVIAADNDGALHKLLSLRFRPEDVSIRARPLFDIYEALSQFLPDIEVILTVEDLSPAGLDATDGIFIARELHARGLTNIIATAGTNQFPPLFDRRVTQKKSAHASDFLSNEPSLASAQWLLMHTDLGVSCCAFLHNRLAAITIAQELGLLSLIEKAQIIHT